MFIYIFTLIVLFILIFRFDLSGNETRFSKEYALSYKLLMMWFILISGFAFNVGSDTPGYMREYDDILSVTGKTLTNLFSYKDQRQPGWLLVEFFCRSVSSDFVLFKLVIAFFSNWAIFRFFKKHSDYPFVSILFYGLILYLNLNFNALRQMVAVAWLLVGFDYFCEKKWLKYYLMILLAYLFHSTAIICAVFPLFLLIPIKKEWMLFYSVLIISVAILLLITGVKDYLGLLLLNNEEYMSDSYQMLSDIYFGINSGESSRLNIKGIIKVVILLCMYSFCVFYYVRDLYYDANYNKSLVALSLVFLFVFVLNFCVPVVFFRFLFYLWPFVICVMATTIVNLSKRSIDYKKLVLFVLIVLFSLDPVSNLYRVNEKSGYPLMTQYAPYHSVLTKEIDPLRASLYGYHN